MASASHAHELNSLSSLVKTLTNSQLKDILRNEGLAVSGVKASLQIRIIECSSSTIRRAWERLAGG
jgi:E3 SUMO-protein ligase PIAS1